MERRIPETEVSVKGGREREREGGRGRSNERRSRVGKRVKEEQRQRTRTLCIFNANRMHRAKNIRAEKGDAIFLGTKERDLYYRESRFLSSLYMMEMHMYRCTRISTLRFCYKRDNWRKRFLRAVRCEDALFLCDSLEL